MFLDIALSMAQASIFLLMLLKEDEFVQNNRKKK